MEIYDVIVLGLGLKVRNHHNYWLYLYFYILKEAVISTKLSLKNHSVLFVGNESTNDYYEMDSQRIQHIHQVTKHLTQVGDVSKWNFDKVCHLVVQNGKF